MIYYYLGVIFWPLSGVVAGLNPAKWVFIRLVFGVIFLAVVGVVYRRELMRAMGIARCMP